jgi:hypothetical protein
MKQAQHKISRRTFLLGAAAGTAATATAIVAKTSSDPSTPGNDVVKSKSGYELTEHVRNYYRTAKI